MTIDNDTGEILAMVGGRDWDKSKLNLATMPCEGCGRQAGSAFKPFTLAAALEQDYSVLTGAYWQGPSSDHDHRSDVRRTRRRCWTPVERR